MKNLLTILFLLFISVLSNAQSRTIEMEFDEVDGATAYEFEFRILNEVEIYKTLHQSTPLVELTLPYNHYEFRQRTRDKRKVPGAWSNWKNISIVIPKVKLTKPGINSRLVTKELETESVQFAWTGADGILEFELRISELKTGKEVLKIRVQNKKEIEVKLPVAQNYQVSVTTVLPEKMPTDLSQSATQSFSLVAGALKAPEINTIKNEFSNEVSWSKNEIAENYQISLERFSPQEKKWIPVYSSNEYKDTKLIFDPKWRRGQYTLKVVAQARLHQASPVVSEEFSLASVRTPAAEYNHLLFRAIDRVDGYYTQMSWLVTRFEILSDNVETLTRAETKPLGGQLRLGGGYFRARALWGITANLTTSHMIINGEDKNFISLDANSMYRHKFSIRDELRLSLGASYKEFPMVIGNQRFLRIDTYRSEVLGPKLAVEYWYSLGPKMGLQANFGQTFYGAFTESKSPNGNKLHIPKSFQAGLMFSYQYSSNVTGLVGLSHQKEEYKYDALPQNATTPLELGVQNSGSLKADYIGLMVEIGL